ncbi:MAG: transketolase [Dehalococcoidales bacterium]|nr:transketolase [Dehalococcoidales bacterium]
MAANEKLIQKLQDKYVTVLKNMFELLDYSMSGHTGGSMSMLDIIIALYFHHLKLNPPDYDWPERDRVVLSKAHCCEAIYSVLVEIGYVSRESLKGYNEYAETFQGHADRWATPGMDYSGGSLGQGLSFACGLAMAEKLKTEMNPPVSEIPQFLPRLKTKHNPAYRTFCVLGDGECNEGQVWEAAMFANKYKLDNLIAIVDYNKFSLDGPTEEIMPMAPFAEKWASFGWWVKEINGHDMAEIINTLELANNLYGDGKPKCIIAHTVKGHGIPSWEETHVHLARGVGVEVGVSEGRMIYG